MKRGRGYLGQFFALLSQTQKNRSQKSLDTGNICEKSFEFRFNLLFYVNANGFTAVNKRLRVPSNQQQYFKVITVLFDFLRLMDDRSKRFQRRTFVRKRLEEDWAESSKQKHDREMEERLHQLAPGALLHEQCDKYHRCQQCKRKVNNCGESNIWRESRYIPGSRLMV